MVSKNEILEGTPKVAIEAIPSWPSPSRGPRFAQNKIYSWLVLCIIFLMLVYCLGMIILVKKIQFFQIVSHTWYVYVIFMDIIILLYYYDPFILSTPSHFLLT